MKAVKINPRDDFAREIILEIGINGIYYSIHHLPHGYIGNYMKDLEFIPKLKTHISKLVDKTKREYWHRRIKPEIEILESYSEWKNSGHPNFDEWGKENHKVVGYNNIETYNYSK